MSIIMQFLIALGSLFYFWGIVGVHFFSNQCGGIFLTKDTYMHTLKTITKLNIIGRIFIIILIIFLCPISSLVHLGYVEIPQKKEYEPSAEDLLKEMRNLADFRTTDVFSYRELREICTELKERGNN